MRLPVERLQACTLKIMQDERNTDLTDAEKLAIAAFDGLVKANTTEINALTNAIESNTGRDGELAVKIVQMKNDLESRFLRIRRKALASQAFVADLDTNCKKKKAVWAECNQMQAQEIELLEKTLPGSAGVKIAQMKT